MSRTQETLRECGRWICHSFDILKAILIRVIFALHATIAIIRIVITKGDYWYLLNMCGVNFLLIELVITVVKRKGKEPKWFSPCFFLYICTMIPPIWFLEINRINIKLGRAPINQTEGDELKSMIEKGLISKANLNDKTDLLVRKIKEWGIEDSMIVEISFMFIIIIGRWILPKGNISHSALSQLLLVYLSLASDILDLLTLFGEQEIYISSPMVHVILIVFSLCMLQFAFNLTATRGRAFYAEYDDEAEIQIQRTQRPVHRKVIEKILPRAKSASNPQPFPSSSSPRTTTTLTPTQPRPRAASFSIIGQPVNTISGNMPTIEIFPNSRSSSLDPQASILRPPTVQRPSITSLNSINTALWNVSRSRYTSRKSIAESVKIFVRKRSAKLLRSEIWSIMVTLCLQDGPFLAIRLVAIFVYRVRSFLMYFFTFKNFLILLLQTYRIISICLEKDAQEQLFEEQLSAIRRISVAASQFAVPLQKIFK